ncbi:hypothetical protein JCM17380_00110 [Desulfosporosinus burensis]
MVKVYSAYIRMIIQVIRYCGGQSRRFTGDGVMENLDMLTDMRTKNYNIGLILPVTGFLLFAILI